MSRRPALYLLMYGEPDADRRLAAAAETDAILRDPVEAVARAGRLRVDVDVAVSIIHATGVGVVIALIERHVLEQFRDEADDPCATLLAIARGISDLSCSPGFRGCPFINAAAEFADPTHPARQAIAAHRAWFTSFLTDLLREMAIHDPETVADQVLILRDGAMVTGYLGPDPATLTDTLVNAGRAVIDNARASTTLPSDTSR